MAHINYKISEAKKRKKEEKFFVWGYSLVGIGMVIGIVGGILCSRTPSYVFGPILGVSVVLMITGGIFLIMS